jgi:hypothetical protein
VDIGAGNQELRRCPLSGCAGQGQTVASGAGFHEIATDGVRLVWSVEQAGTVTACSLPNCTPSSVADGLVNPQRVAVDDAAIYWFIRGSSPTTGEIHACMTPPCSASSTLILGGLGGVGRLTVDATSIYFTTGAGIFACVKNAACVPGTPLVPTIGANNITADATYLYWTKAGVIQRCAKTDCAGSTVVTGDGLGVRDVAVDGETLAWTDRTAIRVMAK